ncbi:unannotated protein [freshwater metagenome]|uniref:Unannotated protein n=1 Tax=freshwater metagenome TaxID=449393 RepID=A0A6J7IEX3_9ZZZZ
MGRAECCGERELFVVEVDRHDHRSVRESGALDDRETDPARADHRDGCAGRYLSGVEHGTDAGEHTAPQQACSIEWHVVADLHQVVLADEHVLSETGEADVLMHHFAVARQTRGLTIASCVLIGEALERATGDATLAVTTERRQARHDVIARLEVSYTEADRLDDPCRLVPQYERRRECHAAAM